MRKAGDYVNVGGGYVCNCGVSDIDLCIGGMDCAALRTEKAGKDSVPIPPKTAALPMTDSCICGAKFDEHLVRRHWLVVENIRDRGYGPRCIDCMVKAVEAVSKFTEPE